MINNNVIAPSVILREIKMYLALKASYIPIFWSSRKELRKETELLQKKKKKKKNRQKKRKKSTSHFLSWLCKFTFLGKSNKELSAFKGCKTKHFHGKKVRPSTRNQFDMYSFVSQSWCAFWQKNDMLLKWSIVKCTSEPKPQKKHIISRTHRSYVIFKSSFYVILWYAFMNRLTA